MRTNLLRKPVVGLVVVTTKPTKSAFPGANGKIVFDSEANINGQNPTGDESIFTINAYGMGLTQLT